MKTPAEKCAERILKSVGLDDIVPAAPMPRRIKEVSAIIQSEYAETFQVAREAMEKAIEYIEPRDPNVGLIRKLRTAMELIPK